MSELRILFTGVGRRVELLQAFRNAALVLGKKVKLYGADAADTAPAFAYCDYAGIVPPMRSEQYIRTLLRICRDDGISLLIPTIDTDLLILSENKRRFEDIGTRVLISSPKTIRICRDKNRTAEFFAECNLHTPLTCNDWKSYQGGYPAFIKPQDGSSSIDAFKVKDADDLELYARQVRDYIVQPFVDGREYTIDILCGWDGKPISIVPRERLQVRSGEVLKTRISMDQAMIEEARTICEACKPCGPLTVQLIREHGTGIDYFIEINPRFGGGAPLSMKAGSKSAEAVLQMLSGDSVHPPSNIAEGAIYSRFDQSVCVHEGKGRIQGVIFDLDDTLYSEKEYVRSGFEAVAKHLGNESYAERLWDYFEDGKLAIDELLREIGRESEKGAALDAYRLHKPVIHLYDGLRETLGALRHKGIRTGIITDGRPEGQRNKIDALGLANLVDDIIITDELGGIQFRKPCDIAFRILLNKWKLLAGETVYIGDNQPKDFQGPQQLGMRNVWFRNEDGLYAKQVGKEMRQHDVISALPDILDILRK